jgi:hypothetical protein
VDKLCRMNEVFAKCVNFGCKIGTEGTTSYTETAVIETAFKSNRVGECDLGVPEHRVLSRCS